MSFSLVPLPIPLINLIREYDITSKPFHPGQRVNIVSSRAWISEIDQLMLQMKSPDALNSKFVSFHAERIPHYDVYEDPIHLHMDKDQRTSMLVGEMYLHQALVTTVDPVAVTLDQKSLFLPWNPHETDRNAKRHLCVEQFAGGFGGWAFALQFLHEAGFPSYQILSIESELIYATQYALSHTCNLVGDPSQLPETFLHNMFEHITICSQIQDLHWQKLLQHVHSDLWCISAPCQSWSYAGNQDGFGAPDGLALGHAIAQSRIHKPKFLAIEQVAGFANHMHFQMTLRLLQWAGYLPVLTGVFDLATLTPCRRARWLGIFIHVSQMTCHLQPKPWPSKPTTARKFDMILNLNNQQCAEFEPSVQQATFYFDQMFMPGITKIWKYADILKYRIPSLDDTLPTFMHLYGQQHSLRPHRLTTMGLFGHFLRQGIAFRFFSPVEILLGHCHHADMILLKPKTIGWETLGNSIAVPHALFALAHVMHSLHPDMVELEVTELILRLIDTRLKASSCTVHQDDFAWYVSGKKTIEHMQKLLHFFLHELNWTENTPLQAWPSGCFFSPSDGLLPLMFFHDDLTQQLQCHVPPPAQATQKDPDDEPWEYLQVMPCLVPGEYGIVHVHKDTTLHTLLRLWKFRLSPAFNFEMDDVRQTVARVFSEPRIMLFPGANDIQEMLEQVYGGIPDPNKLLLHRTSTDLTLYEVEHAKTWKTAKKMFPALDKVKYDMFGDIDDTTFITTDMEVHEHVDPVRIPALASDVLQKLQEVSFETICPPNTDILVLHCTGSKEAKDAFMQFWFTEDHRRWLNQVGRQINLQLIDDTTWRVLFRPTSVATAMPVTVLVDALFWTMSKTIFTCMQERNGTPVTVKMFGKTLCTPTLPESLSCDIFIAVLQHIRQLHPRRGTPSLHAFGKRCGDDCSIQDIRLRQAEAKKIILYVGMPLSGGGGPKLPTSKQDFHRMVQSEVANRFLQYGLDLPQVTDSTSKLIDHIGLSRLLHMIHEEAPSDKDQSFRRICESVGIELPRHGPRMHLVSGKFQKIKNQRSQAATAKIDPAKYHLLEGFFVNADKTHTPILNQFSWQSTGVVLLGAEHATQIMTIANATVPDELAVYVPGELAIPSKFPHVHTHAPAIDDRGRQVLLTGQLIQFGARHVHTNVLPEQIATKEVQVLAVTLWKEDHDEQTWDRIKSSPVRTTRDLLMLEGYGELLSKPWGRAFRSKGQPVPPEHAESVQFHAEFQKGARLHSLLRISGFNHIYLTPKTEDGAVDPGWKVIWLTGNHQQIESLSAQIDGAAGLVRSVKAYGLRVEAGSFAGAWARLKPDQETPDVRQRKHVFRLQPLPVGTDKEILTQWAAQMQWDIRPLRSVGAKAWLIAADEPPPNLVCFNSQPLLVQKVTQKSPQLAGDIVAGPRQPQIQKSEQSQPSQRTNVFREGDPYMDPWKQDISDARQAATEPSVLAAPRSPGPVSDLFQQQGSRLQALETAVAKIHDAQAQHAISTDKKIAHVSDQLTGHIADTKHSIEHLHKEQISMTQSIAQALQKQDDRLASSMDELKFLFLQSRGIKRNNDGDLDDKDEQDA